LIFFISGGGVGKRKRVQFLITLRSENSKKQKLKGQHSCRPIGPNYYLVPHKIGKELREKKEKENGGEICSSTVRGWGTVLGGGQGGVFRT